KLTCPCYRSKPKLDKTKEQLIMSFRATVDFSGRHRSARLFAGTAIGTGLLTFTSIGHGADSSSMRELLNRNLMNPHRQIALSAPNPHGGPYAVLGTNWWQWVFSLPVTDGQGNVTHPLLTSGIVDCSIGQSGQLWFLAGNFGGSTSRNCTVPRNTALFFPI